MMRLPIINLQSQAVNDALTNYAILYLFSYGRVHCHRERILDL